eukprot:1624575-Amphidinium_carterae.1
MVYLPSLRAVEGFWRMGMWATRKTTQDIVENMWTEWASVCRLPARARFRGLHCLRTQLASVYFPPPPNEWANEENILRDATAKCRLPRHGMPRWVLVPDDRDHGKAWLVRLRELFAYLCVQVLEDPTWIFHASLCARDVLAHCVMKGLLGLPPFLRKNRWSAKWAPPYVYPLVKSKCFANCGRRTCAKPNHSCMRRIVCMACFPWASGWKVVARAVRGVVRRTNVSHEMWDLSNTRQTIDGLVYNFGSPLACSCVRCGIQLSTYSAVTLDIDQAFGACDGSKLLGAWAVRESNLWRWQSLNFPFDANSYKQHVQWARYVDDVLAVSQSLCGDCLGTSATSTCER